MPITNRRVKRKPKNSKMNSGTAYSGENRELPAAESGSVKLMSQLARFDVLNSQGGGVTTHKTSLGFSIQKPKLAGSPRCTVYK